MNVVLSLSNIRSSPQTNDLHGTEPRNEPLRFYYVTLVPLCNLVLSGLRCVQVPDHW